MFSGHMINVATDTLQLNLTGFNDWTLSDILY